MNDELESLSPTELDKVFALEVAGWTEILKRVDRSHDEPAHEYWWWRTTDGREAACPDRFSSDANAVLPFLKGFHAYDWHIDKEERERIGSNVCVALINAPCSMAPTFARAACLALIKAKRASR